MTERDIPSTGQSAIIQFGAGLGAWILVLSGPVCGFFLTRIVLEARASSDWPSVPGTITKAEVTEVFAGRYVADVRYTYRVDGSPFDGSRIRASDGEYNIRDGAVQAIGDLTEGQAVRVYYNPADPWESVLRPGAGFEEYVLLFVPIIMFGIGISLLRRLFMCRREQAKSRHIASE